MSSDLAGIWYAMVCEGSESKNNVKILVRTFLAKNIGFFKRMHPQKVTEIEILSDFDEIWYIGVFEGADFKNRIQILVRTFFYPKT